MNNYQDIYIFLQTIPHGKVVSYKTIADKFHIHPRTVGIIMRKNMYPDIYPCYKVLASDGSLRGYTWGGAKEKIRRLQKDWIKVIGDKIDKKYFYFPCDEPK
jgi:O-6-methylguanine DNA methyltransferase